MLSIILTALVEVHVISVNALISAVVFMYETTIWSGYLSRNFLNSSVGQDSAKEHPAFKSGIRTFFCGDKIFAVSAIKLTPAKTIISASVAADFLDKSRLSPTKSAIS